MCRVNGVRWKVRSGTDTVTRTGRHGRSFLGQGGREKKHQKRQVRPGHMAGALGGPAGGTFPRRDTRPAPDVTSSIAQTNGVICSDFRYRRQERRGWPRWPVCKSRRVTRKSSASRMVGQSRSGEIGASCPGLGGNWGGYSRPGAYERAPVALLIDGRRVRQERRHQRDPFPTPGRSAQLPTWATASVLGGVPAGFGAIPRALASSAASGITRSRSYMR